MAKDQPPAFLWYPRDFTASTAGMSDAHELAYRRALDQSWLEECYGVGLPALWRRWSRATDEAWPDLEAALLPHVEVQPDGTWAQVRMAKERMEQELYSRGQSQRGRKGGLTKAKRRRSDATATLKRNVALPLQFASASASASSEKIEPESESKTPPRATPAAPKGAGFVEPTLAEVEAYCRQRASDGKRPVDPHEWFDHYTSNGWKVGPNSMKDWRAAVRTWERSSRVTRGVSAASKMSGPQILAFAAQNQEVKK